METRTITQEVFLNALPMKYSKPSCTPSNTQSLRARQL
jgi:hypothetical protein